jgi:hypothetical protein
MTVIRALCLLDVSGKDPTYLADCLALRIASHRQSIGEKAGQGLAESRV